MNQILFSIIKVYVIASIIYFIYLAYLKITNSISFDVYLQNNEELLNKYNKMNKHKNMVFILGILVGLGVLMLTENKEIVKINPSIVNDISDIAVI